MSRITLLGLCLILASAIAFGADVSGKWQFSVDLDEGGHGDPLFTLDQKGDVLSGTYEGPLGEHPVTGSIQGGKLEIAFTFERDGQKITARYSGAVETAGKMSGIVVIGEGMAKGHWTASKR